MTKYAIYFAVILFPIQTLSLSIKDTAFDLSSILLSITTLFIFFFKKKKNNTHLFILFIFIIYQLVIFIYSPAPFHRFISALYWMVIFIMMFCINEDFKINHQFVEKIIIYILLISCAVSWYQYYYIITPYMKMMNDKFDGKIGQKIMRGR